MKAIKHFEWLSLNLKIAKFTNLKSIAFKSILALVMCVSFNFGLNLLSVHNATITANPQNATIFNEPVTNSTNVGNNFDCATM